MDDLTYTAHPMRESPARAILFWLIVAFTLWAVWWNVQSVLLTVVAALVLIGALTSFILPTRYRIGPEGASYERLTGSKRLEWSRVRSVSDERDGIFLSTFVSRNVLENFRGLYLPYRDNRDDILTLVRKYATNANINEDKDVNGRRG
ncbi:MAG: hypothetical protein FJY67_08280 [Calditrichaeota bacterium]|nr:hypothetical protein [Calditrichota bacterium]